MGVDIYHLMPGQRLCLTGQPEVAIRLEDVPGVFRIDGHAVRPEPPERSIFEWADLPWTGLQVRYLHDQRYVQIRFREETEPQFAR